MRRFFVGKAVGFLIVLAGVFLFLFMKGVWGPVKESVGTNTRVTPTIISGTGGKFKNEEVILPTLATKATESEPTWGMKLIPADVTHEELIRIRNLGITILSGEWGMDVLDPAEMVEFLDRIQAVDLKYIVNFSEESAWGYLGGDEGERGKKPVWQKEKVTDYLIKIKNHPAIYGYDISNEAGENLPNGDQFRITTEQMRFASETVRAEDGTRPVIIRMHYWDEEDGDFDWKNPFVADIADIIMLNLYSNFSFDSRVPFLPQMIEDSAKKLIDKIYGIDPDIDIWLSLGAFRWLPQFIAPNQAELNRDIERALEIPNIKNIGFFGWGNKNPGVGELDWYLPRDAPELLDTVKKYAGEK